MNGEDETADDCQENYSDHAASCAYCGAPMSTSDVDDYRTLCERCYLKEYYGKED